MVSKPLSDKVKIQKAHARNNLCMQHALDAFKQEELKPVGIKQRSYREIANEYLVSKSTLQRLATGGASHAGGGASCCGLLLRVCGSRLSAYTQECVYRRRQHPDCLIG